MRSIVNARAVVQVASAALVGAALLATASCILLDDPADLPSPPTRRPTILSATPAPGVIGEVPTKAFQVQVEIPDPTQSVTYLAILDFNTPSARPLTAQNIIGSPTAPDIATAEFSVPPTRVNDGLCHNIHFLVTLSQTFTGSAVADPSLSDTADWFYAPGGNLGGCSVYDGGANDGSFPDAAPVDASDGGGD